MGEWGASGRGRRAQCAFYGGDPGSWEQFVLARVAGANTGCGRRFW